MTHYILISTDDGREQVLAYETSEMAHTYSFDELVNLTAGLAIFHAGSIHVDMRAAARAVATELLVNG